MKRFLAIGFCVVACQDPPLTIVYEFAEGSCGTADCGEIKMSCDTTLSLRILAPSNPDIPYVAMCEAIPMNAKQDLCAIGNINLDSARIPRQTLEVQVAVWEKTLATNPLTAMPDCLRNPIEFDAVDGFPIPLPMGNGPAFGGRAFYHPGDAETVVTLGCSNRTSVDNPTCNGINDTEVNTVMLDFDNLPISVGSSVGDRLSVAVGEPEFLEGDMQYVLNSAKATPLTRTVPGPIPTWAGKVGTDFKSTACIQATEDAAETTTTLRCVTLSDPNAPTLSIYGVRVTKSTIDDVLRSLSLSSFPEEGLTVGIVIDQNNNPAAGETVTVDPPFTVEFINDNRTGIATGVTKTTNSGMFVSRNAPYRSNFFAMGPTAFTAQVGGLVKGKLTVVAFIPDGVGGSP